MKMRKIIFITAAMSMLVFPSTSQAASAVEGKSQVAGILAELAQSGEGREVGLILREIRGLSSI